MEVKNYWAGVREVTIVGEYFNVYTEKSLETRFKLDSIKEQEIG